MAIKNWSKTPSENNSNPPDGWPEGMAPSAVNDAARKMMADIRGWYEAPEWVDLGYTVSQASATSFLVSGTDASTQFHVGRRVKLAGTATVYGAVASVSYSAPNTTVSVTLDSGSVPADISTAAYSVISATPRSAPAPTGAASTISDSNLTVSRALVSDGSGKVGVSTVTSTQLGYVSGVTSAIQTQLNGKAATSHNHAASDVNSGTFGTARLGSGTANSTTYLRGDGAWTALPSAESVSWGSITGTLSNQSDLNSALAGKQATITGGATTITGSNLTASRALASDGSGKVAVSAVTSAELAHVGGVTSAIQPQLNGKSATSHNHSGVYEPVLATNRKRQIFVQSATPTGQATGDLWIW